MAEGVGLALAVTTLSLHLANKCKNSSTNFRHLHQELQLFHQTLLLAKPYLDYLGDDTRAACEEIALDIQQMLDQYKSRNILRRAKVAFEDIQALRVRLILLSTTLNTSITAIQGYGLGVRDIGSARSGQALTIAFGNTDDNHTDVNQTGSSDLAPNSPCQRRASNPARVSISSTSTLVSASNIPYSPKYARLLNILSPARPLTTRSSQKPTSEEDWPPLLNSPSLSSQNQPEHLQNPIHDSAPAACNKILTMARSQQEGGADVQYIQTLLGQGASLECKDSKDLRTPLIWAINRGNKSLAKAFIAEKALLATRDGHREWTPLIWAVMEDQREILQELIIGGANLTEVDGRLRCTAILWAASAGNCYAVKLLLEKDKELIKATDKEGRTPLALAYFEGHLETAKLLVREGDNPNFKFSCGVSLLAWTIVAKNVDLAQLLLDSGAEVESIDRNKLSALILAIQNNLPGLAERLVLMGAYLQCTDESGLPALTVAVKEQRHDIAEILIRNGANLEATDDDGNTALLWAVSGNDEKLVKLLVDNGANIGFVDVHGNTVQMWAAWTQNETLVQLVS